MSWDTSPARALRLVFLGRGCFRLLALGRSRPFPLTPQATGVEARRCSSAELRLRFLIASPDTVRGYVSSLLTPAWSYTRRFLILPFCSDHLSGPGVERSSAVREIKRKKGGWQGVIAGGRAKSCMSRFIQVAKGIYLFNPSGYAVQACRPRSSIAAPASSITHCA